MIVEMSRINRVFGDRVLVRRLGRPEKRSGLYMPQNYLKDKPKEQQVWFGVIEKFGLDSRYGEAYGLKEGDIVGINDLGISNSSFIGDDDLEHFWVMEEFLALKDEGRVAAFQKDEKFEGLGLTPLGAYSIIKPRPEEEKRSGIIIPDTAKDPSLIGKVLEVSIGQVKGNELIALNVNNESDVLFGKYSGLYAKFGREEYVLIKEEDLISELSPINKEKELAHA